MKTRTRRGFTLPEVLVTVTVVAVLAAVVVPAVTGFVNRGNSPATQQDIQQLQTAVNGYVTDLRAYPAYLSDLTTTSGHGPYLQASVSSATGTTATTGSAFTSNGINVTFADSIDNSGGFLSLFVSTSTPCARLLALDTLYDATGGQTGGATGNVTWTGTCAQGTPTGTFSVANLKFMAAGK